MFNDILLFLKFIVDPNARDTLSGILSFVSKTQKNWRKDVKTIKAEFIGNETYALSVYANSLLGEFEKIGLSDNKISDFNIIFSELVNNAFEHGCKFTDKCHVKITCTYSRWFIQLQVSDSGKGFNLASSVQTDDFWKFSEQDKKVTKHGLQIVNNLAIRLYTNKRGNSVTAILSGQDSMSVAPAIQKYKNQELLVIHISTEQAWHYVVADWKPLLRIVHSYEKNDLVLIDATDIFWTTKVRSQARQIIDSLAEAPNRFFAFSVSHKAGEIFDLNALSNENTKVFHSDEIEKAKNWLIEQHRKSKLRH